MSAERSPTQEAVRPTSDDVVDLVAMEAAEAAGGAEAATIAADLARSGPAAAGLFVRRDHGRASEVLADAPGSVPIEEILQRFARLALMTTGAERATIFRLGRESRSLSLWAAASRSPDPQQWEAGLALGAIPLDDVPERWSALQRRDAVAVPDAGASQLIPPDWADAFDVGAAVLAPLHSDGEILGVLVVDWREPRDLPDGIVGVTEAVAGSLAPSMASALAHERVDAKMATLERLVGVAGALTSSSSLDVVLRLVCSAFEDVLGATHCSVFVVDPSESHGVRLLSWTGEPWFAGYREWAQQVTKEQVEAVLARCGETAEPLVYRDVRALGFVDRSLIPDRVAGACLFPLQVGDGLAGLVVTGFPQSMTLGRETVDEGRMLAGLATAALDRTRLHERLRRRLQRLEVLYRLSDVIVGTADLSRAIADLNGLLDADLDIHLDGISVADAGLRHLLGASRPDGAELTAVRRWRADLARGASLRPLPFAPDCVLVPVAQHDHVQGVMRATVRRPLGRSDDELLLAIGAGCAEVVHRAGLTRALAESERRFLVNSERERIARDLHDSTAQLMTGMGMLLAEYVAEAPDATWWRRLDELKCLATQGVDDLRQAIHALLFQEVRRKGLAGALRDLVSNFEATSGIEVEMRVDLGASDLTAAHQDALFRVAHEALRNVERHSGASRVVVELAEDHHGARLCVRDDGVGLRDDAVAARGHFGLRELERRVADVGGELTVSNVEPHGVAIEARFGSHHG